MTTIKQIKDLFTLLITGVISFYETYKQKSKMYNSGKPRSFQNSLNKDIYEIISTFT